VSGNDADPAALEDYRLAARAWLEQAEKPALSLDYDENFPLLKAWQRTLYDAGWVGIAWPTQYGGRGLTKRHALAFAEELARARAPQPGGSIGLEVVGPTILGYGTEEQCAKLLPPLLSGEETWCQGFSEPGTGSNLASLSCRATSTDDGWRVTGQKVWTSLAQYAQRCILLTRTGSQESAHRGITALFVDMDTPGITVRPIETMHGAPEFSEVFFDDVGVPFDRTLGSEGQGWSVAMDLLPYERSTALWHRAAFLHRRLQQLLEAAPAGALDPARVGEVTQILYAFRARSRATQHRLHAGEQLGAETSIDKVLVATAEQAVFDLVADGLAAELTIGDEPSSTRWRSEFLYSRAATIYGGSAEIQRNIIARRLLELGNDR
jgi:alkylation response protein AidB-like acyl-CoA dehydrogenase